MRAKAALHFWLLTTVILFAHSKCWAQRPPPVQPAADRQPRLVVNSDYENRVNAIAVAPDGSSILVGGADGAARVIDIKSGRERQRLAGYAEQIDHATFSPAARFALLANDSRVYLWDLSIGQQAWARNARAAAVMPDDNSVLIVSPDGVARVVEARTGTEVRRLKMPTAEISRIVFAARGDLALLIGDKDTARLWNFVAEKEVQVFRGLASPQAIAFAPDGKAVAFSSGDGAVHLWDLAAAREVRVVNALSNAPLIVRYAPDGRALLAATPAGQADLLDVQTGRSMRHFEVGALDTLDFAPDAKTFATSGNDAVRIWEVTTGKELQHLAASSGGVSFITYTPDAHMLITCGHDKAAHLWDATTGAEVGRLFSFRREAGEAPDGNQWLVDAPDGLFDGSEGGWHQALWRAQNNSFDVAPIEAFFSDFFYPGLLADLLAGRGPRAPQEVTSKDRRPPKLKLALAADQDTSSAGLTTRNIKVLLEVAEAPAGPNYQQGSGAFDVRLFRNGLLVKSWRGDVLQGKPYRTLEAELPITAGENRLSAYAFNHDNVLSPTVRLVVTGAPSLKRKGTAYIVAVGINQYDNSQFNVKYAVADAQAFGDELKRQQEKLGTFGRIELISLIDQQATKANILGVLGRLAGKPIDTADRSSAGPLFENVKQVQPEDAVFIYFATHGTAQNNHYYLIAHDMGFSGQRSELKVEDLKGILEHGISDLELADVFAGIDAGRFLIVLDASSSGQALEANDKRVGPMNSKGLAQLAYEKGIFFLAASQSYQAAVEDNKFGHGLLTYVLVEEGLKTTAADIAPKDGKVSMLEWLQYAVGRVPEIQIEREKEREKRHHAVVKLINDSDNVQRPRIFYRRETEPQSFIIATPTQPLKKAMQNSDQK